MLADRPNFGDELTVELARRLFRTECTWASPSRSEMIGAGSTLEMVQELRAPSGLKVWGSGFMKDKDRYDRPDFDFYAVRGYHTLSRIDSDREVAIGDPGLLASLVYERSETVAGRIGIAYHHSQKRQVLADARFDAPRFKLIDPLRNPTEVIKDITSCEFVFASSLHGLIIADSYGVPNTWATLGSSNNNDCYKFEDYYSAFDFHAARHGNDVVFDDEAIKQFTADYTGVPDLERLQQGLVDAFPYAAAAA